ncbi:MAG: aromatic amino acid lyase [Gammaproteobacteria bacterium]
MTLVLTARRDINLATFYRVAWQREGVRLADEAVAKIASCRESFLRLIDGDPSVTVYGVTTSTGERASHRLSSRERDVHGGAKLFSAATSFGDPLPTRVVRGIIFARLANFLEGHSATSTRIALAVAEMLNGAEVPCVAGSGQGGAGEILALYPLFADLSTRFDLKVKERGSLINGSPCAAALVADSALAARRRVRLAEKVFALSIEAFHAPLEHFDALLDSLWGDPHEAAALQGLRHYLVGAGQGRRDHQAPVSYRIVPRVLGHAHRALAAAEHAAGVSLPSVSDNPVYLEPDAEHPLGRAISTGGFHNAMAAPALDDLAAIWADLCLLCERHSTKLLNGRFSQLPDLLLVGRDPGTSDGRGAIGYVTMAQCGYVEQAKSAAQRTFIPGGDPTGTGQDDVGTPVFLAWAKEERAGRYFDASLAALAAIASQALYATDRQAPPPLRDFVEWVRSILPPLVEDRVLGPQLGSLADGLTQQVFTSQGP